MPPPTTTAGPAMTAIIVSQVGAGMTLWPNALRALDAIGVGDRIRSVGLAQVAGGIRDSSGKWLSRTDTGAMARRFGDGMIVLPRMRLRMRCCGTILSTWPPHQPGRWPGRAGRRCRTRDDAQPRAGRLPGPGRRRRTCGGPRSTDGRGQRPCRAVAGLRQPPAGPGYTASPDDPGPRAPPAALRGRVPTAIRNALISAIPATMSLRALDAVVDWTAPTS